MNEVDALILSDAPQLASAQKIARLLAFFGVAYRWVRPADFDPRAALGVRVFCPAEVFLKWLAGLKQTPRTGGLAGGCLHSIFVCPAEDTSFLPSLTDALEQAALGETRGAEFIVRDDPEFCGVMAGIRCSVPPGESGPGPCLNVAGATTLIARGDGAVFLRLELGGVPVFLGTSSSIIDLDADMTAQHFDVRDQFLAAVPVVMYVKWAFAGSCWQVPEINACLVIDDPLLKPDFGYVNYAKFLALMKQYLFSTNIAFIPWNWKRSDPQVVRIFREYPDQFSLSIHGCDHTAGEFGRQDAGWLTRRTRQALERMDHHAAQTALQHDRVMVFPQGVFAGLVPGILKQHNFMAAVNSDIFSSDPIPRPIKASSVWNVAVMDYDNFPIFTRRDLSVGVENFAFDILLGKPCIDLIHHDFCRNGCAALVQAIQRLNALPVRLNWRSLGEVVRRGFRQRPVSAGVVAVEMFGGELRLENVLPEKRLFQISKPETEPALVKEILVDNQAVKWTISQGRLTFEVELAAAQSSLIQVKFHELAGPEPAGDSLLYRFKTGLRRHLCEVRDNYVTKIKFALRKPNVKP